MERCTACRPSGAPSEKFSSQRFGQNFEFRTYEYARRRIWILLEVGELFSIFVSLSLVLKSALCSVLVCV